MTGPFTQQWDENYLAQLDHEQARTLTRKVMTHLPGIDAKAAHILTLAEDSGRLIAAIHAALKHQLVTMSFVETVVKGPNIGWNRLVSYWDGVLGEDRRVALLEDVENSLGEAKYADELQASGAEVNLQVSLGINYIDIVAGLAAPTCLSAAAWSAQGRVVSAEVTFACRTLGIDFKSYGKPGNFAANRKAIAKHVRISNVSFGAAGVATVKDFWRFSEPDRAAAFRVVNRTTAALLVSNFSKAQLRDEATRILDEGRRYCGRAQNQSVRRP